MKLSESDLEKLAKLAKLELNESEKTDFREKIQQILNFVSLVEKSSVEFADFKEALVEVEPMLLRSDGVEDAMVLAGALEIAPSTTGSSFRVPRFHD